MPLLKTMLILLQVQHFIQEQRQKLKLSQIALKQKSTSVKAAVLRIRILFPSFENVNGQ